MNKVEKSLRWVVNQIPDFKPTTNEEKMLVAIKLYSEAGAEEIKRLEAENAAMRERLEKTIELPFFQKDGEAIVLIYKNKDGVVFTETYFEDVYYGEKRGDDVAEARFEEIRKDD